VRKERFGGGGGKKTPISSCATTSKKAEKKEKYGGQVGLTNTNIGTFNHCNRRERRGEESKGGKGEKKKNHNKCALLLNIGAAEKERNRKKKKRKGSGIAVTQSFCKFRQEPEKNGGGKGRKKRTRRLLLGFGGGKKKKPGGKKEGCKFAPTPSFRSLPARTTLFLQPRKKKTSKKGRRKRQKADTQPVAMYQNALSSASPKRGKGGEKEKERGKCQTKDHSAD